MNDAYFDDDAEVIEFPLGNRTVMLKLTSFDEIDTDEVTKIQYHNIIGELLTCSTVLNRLGNMVAAAEESLSRAKLSQEIFYAQEYAKVAKEGTTSYENTKGRKVVEVPSTNKIEPVIKATPEYASKVKEVIRLQKQRDIINSLYWAVKSKDDKLNKLTDKIRPEDFDRELLEEEINGILIRIKEQ